MQWIIVNLAMDFSNFMYFSDIHYFGSNSAFSLCLKAFRKAMGRVALRLVQL